MPWGQTARACFAAKSLEKPSGLALGNGSQDKEREYADCKVALEHDVSHSMIGSGGK